MDTILQQISESEFSKLKAPILFYDNKTSICFGQISKDNSTFRLAWQSDLVNPILTKISSGIYSIGIDQNYAVVDFDANAILLNLSLTHIFYDTKIFENHLFVITELEIIKIDKVTLKIVERYGLPDIFEQITFNDKQIEVRCMGNMIIYL